MSEIHFNVSGPIDELPRFTHADDLNGPPQQHWFLNPERPDGTSLLAYVPDSLRGGGDVTHQGTTQRLIFAGPGRWEANLPPVKPPEVESLDLVYRYPRLVTKGKYFATEFGKPYKVVGIDGYGWFWRYATGQPIDHLINEALELGFTDVRVFFAGDIRRNRFCDLWPSRADYPWQAVAPFLQSMLEKRLRIWPTHGDMGEYRMDGVDYPGVCPTAQQQAAYFEKQWSLMAGFPNCNAGQYYNEPPKNGYIAGIPKKVTGMLLDTGSGLSGEPPVAPFLDFADMHPGRGWDAHSGNYKSVGDMLLDPIYFGYPGGPTNEPFSGIGDIPGLVWEGDGFGEIGGRRQTSPMLAYEIAAIALGYNGTFFHHDENPSGKNLGPNQRKCAEAYIYGATGKAWPG